MRPDYKNWMPKGMIFSFAAGAVASALLCLLFACTGLLAGGTLKTVLIIIFAVLTMIFCGLTVWSVLMYRAFDYNGIIGLAQQELEDYKNREGSTVKGQEWYKTAIQNTKAKPLTAVVTHGVHQFSPVQLRLITDMERMGIDIIFLFNYQKKYTQIYASWEEIYGCFDVPMRHDQDSSIQIGEVFLFCDTQE